MSTPDQPCTLHDILCEEAMAGRLSEDWRTDRVENSLTDAKAREVGKSLWLVP